MVKQLLVVLCVVAVATGCATTNDGPEPAARESTGGASRSHASADQPSTQAQSSAETDANRLFRESQEARSRGLYSQSMALAFRALLADPDSEAGRNAKNELEGFASGLRMEAGDQWLDGGGRQGPQYAMDLVTTGGPLPTVQLTYNEGPARFTVAAMPVEFSVVEGEARFSDVVPTSDFGTATAPVLALTLDESPIIVEAMPVLSADGSRYEFTGAAVRFVYNPPSTPAVLLTSLLDAEGVSPAPILADALLPAIEASIGSATVLSANMLGADAAPLIRGVARKVQELAREMDTPAVIVATVELERVSQVQFQGRDYNIHQAMGRVRVEVRGITGGQVLYSLASDELRGQGGNEEAARLDLLELAADEIRAATSQIIEGLRAAVRIDLEQ